MPYEAEEGDGFEAVPASLPASELKKVRGVPPKRPIDVERLQRDDRGAARCSRLGRRLLPWGDRVMMRRQLLNLKQIAEAAEK